MKIVFFLAVLAIFWGGSESVVVDCEYYDYGETGNGYTCRVENAELITSKDDREITGIRGQHLSGKNDDDVVGFEAIIKRVDFFPRRLTSFFKNIQNLQIYGANLQEITIDDLKEFNNNLEKLWLFNNNINHIEKFALSGLKNLVTLHLYNNRCTDISDLASNDRTKVLTLITSIEAKCSNPTAERTRN